MMCVCVYICIYIYTHTHHTKYIFQTEKKFSTKYNVEEALHYILSPCSDSELSELEDDDNEEPDLDVMNVDVNVDSDSGENNSCMQLKHL